MLFRSPDLELLATIADAVPDAAIIASAGVGSADEIRLLARAGYAGAILGRALYERRLTLADALDAARG